MAARMLRSMFKHILAHQRDFVQPKQPSNSVTLLRDAPFSRVYDGRMLYDQLLSGTLTKH